MSADRANYSDETPLLGIEIEPELISPEAAKVRLPIQSVLRSGPTPAANQSREDKVFLGINNY